MKTLLCSVPDVPIGNGKNSNVSMLDSRETWLPIGILRILSWMEENYLISLNKNSSARGVRILNYINKTNASNKEVYYWTYLYRKYQHYGHFLPSKIKFVKYR